MEAMGSDRNNRNGAGRARVSVVCVFNDPAVLESCLRRSIHGGRDAAPHTELIAVDNRHHKFATAGAALNSGARSARNEVIAFVHQDVYLHSLPALEVAAANLLESPGIGLVGAVGITGQGRLVGRIRDRVVPLGDRAPSPRDVDSLDEVLILVRREDVLRSPLTEDHLLAWHAYAVEYAARVRRAGKRATALDIPITHNSMTTNLNNLDLAHQRVGELYPELLPIQTTCGTIRKEPGAVGRLMRTLFQRGRGAHVWWRESVLAARIARFAPRTQIVLADIRFLIDRAAGMARLETLRVLDLAQPGEDTTAVSGLDREHRPYSAATVGLTDMNVAIAARPPNEALVLTNLTPADLGLLDLRAHTPNVAGLSRDAGIWIFIGASPEKLSPLWSSRRNRPFAGLVPPRVLGQRPTLWIGT